MLKNARFAALAVALVTAQCMFAQNLVSSEYLGDRSLSNLQAQFGPLIQNGVKLYKLTYTTPDAFSQPDTASGLIAVPDRSGDWAYPLLCFQHGTVDSRSDAPSNLRGGYQAALVFGGMGYISIMPDFLGIGDSRGFHPYVHAATEASVGVDMLRAAEAFVQTLNHVAVNPEQQVFVCGYSQGGHAAMALQRSLEQDYPDEFNLIASAPMSGPYSISGAMIDALSSDDEYFYQAYIPNTFLSYNYVYGLYDSIQQAFKEPYAGLMQQYFEEQITLSELNDTLIHTLTNLAGGSKPKYMIQDSLFDAILNNPDHPVNVALRANDVYDWTPQVPTRLYYCMNDDQVVYTNSVLADSVMNANGAPDVHAIDVDPSADHGGCVQPAFIATILFFAPHQVVSQINAATDPKWSQIRIGPVPASDFVAVYDAPESTEAMVYYPDGKMADYTILETGNGQIPLGKLPAGMYYLVLKKGTHLTVKPVVKR